MKGVDDEKPTHFLQAIAMDHLWRQDCSRFIVYYNAECSYHLFDIKGLICK